MDWALVPPLAMPLTESVPTDVSEVVMVSSVER